jgi:hypothetical protein
MRRYIKLAVTSSVLFNVPIAASGVWTRSYDAFTHMFFASHYLKRWFSLWEPRWYTGFNVASYPPLVHQIMALIAFIWGLKVAFAIVAVVSAAILPIVVYHYAKVYVSEDGASMASLISAFWPSVYVSLYALGQITTIVALLFALTAFFFLDRYLVNCGRFNLAMSAVATICVVSSNLFTVIFLPFLFLPLLFKYFKGVTIRRLAVFSAVVAISSSMAVLPTWLFLLSAPRQAEIPHFSRMNWMEHPEAFWAPWACLVIVSSACLFVSLPFLIFRLRRKPHNLWGILLSLCLLFILGLGAMTPLPRILFGEFWRWLTYDRFMFWASIVVIPLVGDFVANKKGRSKFAICLIASLAVGSAIASFIPIITPYEPDAIDIKPIINFLAEGRNSEYRYITLGFGDQMAWLSCNTDASSVDGNYPTGRTLPILVSSGIDKLDNAKFYSNGTRVLEAVLGNAERYNLKWVFCADKFYVPILIEHGFIKINEYNDSRVEIYEYKPLKAANISTEPNFPLVLTMLQGIAPMFSFVLMIILLALGSKHRLYTMMHGVGGAFKHFWSNSWRTNRLKNNHYLHLVFTIKKMGKKSRYGADSAEYMKAVKLAPIISK